MWLRRDGLTDSFESFLSKGAFATEVSGFVEATVPEGGLRWRDFGIGISMDDFAPATVYAYPLPRFRRSA